MSLFGLSVSGVETKTRFSTCLPAVYSNSSTVHNRGNSDFLSASADTCTRYQGLEGNFNASSPVSSVTSPGNMRDG